MTRNIELGGGYAMGRKICITSPFAGVDGDDEAYTVVAIDGNSGEILDNVVVHTVEEENAAFDGLFMKYAGELQKTMYHKLTPGGKYTLVHLGEFGFPVARKITFHFMDFRSYAQYSDVVRLEYTPYRKRKRVEQVFYGTSIYIFEGWQNLDEAAIYETLSEEDGVITRQSKYSCFDARYMEDMENLFENPVVIWKNYKAGVNGKTYG